MKLALFDFDGTITTADSLVKFIQYAAGKSNYYIGLFALSPILLAYSLRIISNDFAKERLVTYYFKGWDISRFKILADQFSLEQLDKIIRSKATEKIRWHQQRGHKIVIVSATMECWLKAWCQKNGVDLIGTKLEVRNGKLTGKFVSKNCYGIEKVKRIKKSYDLEHYDYIYAYGDSSGDKELLALADEGFYKPFR